MTPMERVQRAAAVNKSREAFTPFIESPSAKHHPAGAREAGKARFESLLDSPFDLNQPGEIGRLGAETSPYTGKTLGVDYPQCQTDALLDGVRDAWGPWKRARAAERVAICADILQAWSEDVFANTYATMHTAGQAFMLSFAGSGASSLDRGLEALAAAHSAMADVPETTVFERRFGRGEPVVLHKRYRLVPVGIALVFSCGSYPAWNAYPAILANLATGNPVVLKPHPDTILPMAMAVKTARAVLAKAGFNPNLLVLACDTWNAPIAEDILVHPDVAIIDFTGGQTYGRHLEQTYAYKQVYTETAGCNAVVIDSVQDVDAVCRALATGLSLFSAQMCTAPQNLWFSADGVTTPDGVVSVDAFVSRLISAIDALCTKHGPAVCGALHSARTGDDLHAAAAAGTVLRPSTPYTHPDFPNARTATPLLVRVDADDRAVVQREHFGPIGFVLVAQDRDDALAKATSDANHYGAIASYAYTTDSSWMASVQYAFADAGASVGINLVRQAPMNFTAAFSDFHVTGLNPAGTACLTDAAFVTRRFRIVQSKVEQPSPPEAGEREG
jgi:phenylacetic acid degradation protein paaN